MKYHNTKTKMDGYTFDSKREANRWLVLKAMEESGEISDLRRQVRFILINGQRWSDGRKHRDVCYIADFVYFNNGRTVVEDCKGYRTDLYRIKRELMKERFGIEIKET